MKAIITSILIVTCLVPGFSQNESHYTIVPVADALFHMYYDSSTAKSTIVEFDKFIALLEVPIKNEGGGATNLKDHVNGGNRVIATLKKQFPNKPLKYLLHTHWHPHSISSVKPFISNGVTLVTTRSNFEKIKEFVDPNVLQQHSKNIQFIDTDSLVIKDRKNHLVAHRFLKKDFKSTPTPEYVYFFLPKYKALHSGCMLFRVPGKVEGREIVTDRVRDLNAFIESKNLAPIYFIRFNGDKEESNGLVKFSDFQTLTGSGITQQEIATKYFSFTETVLKEKQDSILQVLVHNTVPVSFVNDAVYNCLRKKELSKALSFAQLQTLLNPTDANAWDTLGEVYYFLNQRDLATYYEKQTLKVNPAFTAGGEKVWKTDLAEYEKFWGTK